MAVITLTIVESSDQLIDGIPKYIIIRASISSSIFYTFDGTVPTISSDLYVGGRLLLPTNEGAILLKLYATNGVDSSAVVEQYYGPNTNNIRNLFSQVLNTASITDKAHNSFPYSDRGPNLPAEYDGVGLEMMHNPNNAGIFDGYDGQGNTANLLDKSLSEYDIRYSTTNNIGETGQGIGNLPAEVTENLPDPPPIISSTSQGSFDAKAQVIYQDASDQADQNLNLINRPNFSLESLETTKDGGLLGATEALPTTGGFVRAGYNPKDGTVTFYYFDSQSLRWIISKQPYTFSKDKNKSMAQIVPDSRTNGSRFVYKWLPFSRRVLI